MNDELIAEIAALNPVAPVGDACSRARYSSTFPFQPRLNSANVAGVLKPANPGGSVDGNLAPPARRFVFPLSSSAEINASTFGLQTSGASASPSGWSRSIGTPSVSLNSSAL